MPRLSACAGAPAEAALTRAFALRVHAHPHPHLLLARPIRLLTPCFPLAPRRQVSFHVDVTTGHVRTVAGCFFNSATYDGATDEFVGFAVYRNGTTIKDVFQAVARVPANATRACALGPVVFGEGGSGPFATVAGSLVAFDAEARLLYVYLLRKDGAFSLVEVESETGRLTAFEPTLTDVELPTAIVVSALCSAGGGEGCAGGGAGAGR